MKVIDQALDADDIPRAAEYAESARNQGSRDPLVINLVAWRREEDGRFDEAVALLREALAITPDDATLYLGLGSAMRKAGLMKDAVGAFEAAIELDPGYAAAWFARGSAFNAGGATKDAIDDFRQVLRLDPQHDAAMGALAGALAKRGELDEAALLANRALALRPQSRIASVALAQIAIEQKRYGDAVAILEPLAQNGSDSGDGDDLVAAFSALGDALEGSGAFDQAYEAYQRAQDLFEQVHRARLPSDFIDPSESTAQMIRELTRIEPRLLAGAHGGVQSPVEHHVILTGYPRSGTTLVENILATHPGVVAIEECPTLRGLEPYLTAAGLERFAQADAGEVERLRADYWERAARAANVDLTGKILVDMDPFKGARLPYIAKLFPEAKVIVMRRDPRDVVWSCFHTSFGFNTGTLAFTSLESTARHYDLTWQLIFQSLERLPIERFELFYHRLVRDFDVTTQQLCAFIGIPWSESLRRFDRTAQERGVSTASAPQVRKGLYDGTGGWQRYASQLATVEPILKPWIDAFESVSNRSDQLPDLGTDAEL